jgi:GT2 family glycosyltransferase
MTTSLPWKVLHVSTRDPLPELTADPGIGGLLVVFWCDRIPLGQLSLPASLLPITSEQLVATVPPIIAPAVAQRLLEIGFDPPLPVPDRKQPAQATPLLDDVLALHRPLASVSQSSKSKVTDTTAPSVSVIVCTRNRPEYLELCLSSILDLSPLPDEIIVVDNDPSCEVTRRVTDRFPEVRYIPEPQPGLSVARNTGVLNCNGNVVAFTDDDVQVHPAWIDAIRTEFCDSDLSAMTGMVLPAELETAAQQVFQRDSLGWGWGYRALDFDRTFFNAMKHVGVPVWRIGAGANMAFRRDMFDRVGLFDQRLGAGASGCSEDSELWYRLLAEGHRCRYSPAAVVFHHHRSDWAGLSEQLYSYMRGHVAALFVQFERYGHWGNLYRAFVGLPWYLVKVALHGGKRRFGRVLYGRTAKPLAQPAAPQILGALAGYFYYLRHRARHPYVAVPPVVDARITVR